MPSAWLRHWRPTSPSTATVHRDRHGPGARGPALVTITEEPERWLVRQMFDDPAGDHDWAIPAEVDLAASDEEGFAVVWITEWPPNTDGESDVSPRRDRDLGTPKWPTHRVESYDSPGVGAPVRPAVEAACRRRFEDDLSASMIH